MLDEELAGTISLRVQLSLCRAFEQEKLRGSPSVGLSRGLLSAVQYPPRREREAGLRFEHVVSN